MKLYRIVYVASIVLATSVSFSSCEKDADTEKPVIELISPTVEQLFAPGDVIQFEANFSDNTELSAYKIDIHSDFDSHTHKKSEIEGAAWSFQKSWNFAPGLQSSHVKHVEIEIPITINSEPIAHGHYHFVVYATDTAGNEHWIAIEVEIE